MRAAIAAALVLLAGPAWSADRCLSKSEARKLWPDRHLYWSSLGRHRCWSSRPGRRAAVVRVTPTSGAQDTPPPPLPFILPPAEIATAPTRPWSDRWEWMMEARAALHDEIPSDAVTQTVPSLSGVATRGALNERGVIYSTFRGEEPDVWPAPPSNKDAAWMVLLFGLAAVAAVLIWRVVKC